MRLPSRVILFAFCIFSSFACYAEYDRLFCPGGEDTLNEKLVVTDTNALLYKDFASAPTKIEPLTILWRLTVPKAKDPNDPVVVNDGKEYYCVGSPDGDEWGYIEKGKVTSWMTRFVFAPMPPNDDCSFKVLDKSFSKKDYVDASDDQIEDSTVAQISDVPPGFSSFAFILNESNGQVNNQKDKGLTVDPNDFKNVMIYNTPITDGATGGKAAASNVKKSDVGLDIVFVVDTTGSMQPMIDKAINVCEAIAKQVKDASEVHFGLVEYRDSESSEDGDFGAKVVCALTESYDAFLEKLNSLQAEGGGDEPEDVMLGLKTAVDSAKWHDNTSKHIILIGDAPNKPTKEAGTITNFKQLYGYTNSGLIGDTQTQAFQRILFHAIVGGGNPLTELEFNEVAKNNDEGMGYFGNMSKNPNVADELTKILSEGITATEEDNASSSGDGVVAKSVWKLKKIVENGQQGAKSADNNRVKGYACARTNKDEKCASLNILVLRSEMEDFEDSLNQAYRRLDKLNASGSGNVKVIFDSFLEEYVGIASGSATDEDYEMNLSEILGLQMPVKTKTLKMSFKDVMRMNDKARATWMNDIKDARDRVKTILNQKERWVETYHEKDDRAQKFAFIPIEDLP